MKKTRTLFLLLILILGMALGAQAQNVAITDDGAYTADPSAMLDVKSTDKGMLVPRIDFNDKPTTPATGLLVFVTDNGPEGNNAFYYYSGTEWVKIAKEITEADPVYTSSEAANITAGDITNLGNLSGTNTGDQTLDEILAVNTNAGAKNITNLADPAAAQDAATKAYVDALETRLNDLETQLNAVHTVQGRLDGGITPMAIYNSDNSLLDSLYGKTYQGGLIFYLNTTTGTGLLAAPTNHTYVQWGCPGIDIAGASGIAVGTGAQNTIDIEAECTTTGIGADICANLTTGGYTDWFLPSEDELNYMFVNLKQRSLGSFVDTYYWSSTEYNATAVWRQNFITGAHGLTLKDNGSYVRAARAF